LVDNKEDTYYTGNSSKRFENSGEHEFGELEESANDKNSFNAQGHNSPN